MKEIVVENDIEVGELTTKQNRAFATSPMVLVEKYRSYQHERKFESLEFSLPVAFGPFSCKNTGLTDIGAKNVVAIMDGAFERCARLYDLRHLNIRADTVIGRDAFFGIATDNSVDYVVLPPMTEEQLQVSSITLNKDRWARTDIRFHAPDDATGKALENLGVAVRYPDGTTVGWCQRDIDKAVRRVVTRLDEGEDQVRAVVEGVSTRFIITYNKTHVEDLNTEMVFGVNPFDEVNTVVEFVEHAIERRMNNDEA